MSDLRKSFGRKLRRIRRAKDLTQEQLAERAGLSIEFISLMERGQNNPSFETLEKLAAVLEVEVEEFFRFKD